MTPPPKVPLLSIKVLLIIVKFNGIPIDTTSISCAIDKSTVGDIKGGTSCVPGYVHDTTKKSGTVISESTSCDTE